MNSESSAPIRVLHCCYSLAGGGAERQLALLCEVGVSHGIQSTTIYVEQRGASIAPERDLIKHERKGKLDLSITRTIIRAIDALQPDIIHAWLPPVILIPALWAGAVRKRPVIISYRSAKRFHGWLSVCEYLTAWPLARGVISNTTIATCSKPHQRLYKSKQGVVIRNGVSVPPSMVRVLPPDKRPDEPLKMIFVGRILAIKNWRNLVEALRQIGDKIPWTLTVCGDGVDRADFEAAINEAGLQDRVGFRGFVPEVYEELALADVLILPSWSEGMPNVVVEAFALGTAAVLSDIPAHRDLLGSSEAAMLFPPADAGRLAQILIDLRADPSQLQSLSQRGLQLAGNFSPDKMAAAHREYYEAVLKRQ